MQYVTLSRHSSLNELRSLVSLLKPRDIFPCVEDPEKLTYLDLEGCFGDLCNLAYGTYLRNRTIISHANREEALERVLTEHWAHDDLSEDEADDEDDVLVTLESPARESELPHSSDHSPVTKCSGVGQVLFSEGKVMDIAVNGGDEKKDEIRQQGNCSSSTELPESNDALLYDDQISCLDMINYYIEIGRKGANVRLKSVDGKGDEVLL